MKQILIAVLFLLNGLVSGAQNKNENGVKGFWVVESNKSNPKESTVFFYTDSSQLIYSEKIVGIKLKCHKSKTRKRLDAALQNAIVIWQKDQLMGFDLVKASINSRL